MTTRIGVEAPTLPEKPMGEAMDIRQSTAAYEDWLRRQLKNDMVEGDLKEKHEKMCEGPFPFLRATYWRWAEKIFDVCRDFDLQRAPTVLAVGDMHLENFGTWRDVEGRMVWGVNDFDEAAELPYLLDPIRLATSAVLARSPRDISVATICANVRDGYQDGLEERHAFVLDARHRRLRRAYELLEKARARFWRKMDPAKQKTETPPIRFVRALEAAQPEPGHKLIYWRRTAGAGSLGRPRWVAYGTWRCAPVVREAKAMVPSAWYLAHGPAPQRLLIADIARGKYRSPDPWYALDGNILVRRLSPNNRKIGIDDVKDSSELVNPRMLWAMGCDVAATHLGVGDRSAAIAADLATRDQHWFRGAVEAAAAFIRREQKEYARSAKTG